MQDNESFDLRLLWLLLIPGILVGAVLARVFVFHVGDDKATTSSATSTMQVSVQPQIGRCAVPSADQLSQQATAVEAQVTSVNATTAELRVTRVLSGPQVGVIQVQLPVKGVTDTMTPAFTEGGSYLLAVSADGTLAGCGLSGKDTGDLQSLYTKAFG